jgi:arsenate reductase
MTITVYHYPNCSTCKKALKWLEQHAVAHERVDIVQHPPSSAQLATALNRGPLALRSLFNTSGQSYRDGNYKERLPKLSESEALAALAEDGKLIKRPLVLGNGVALAGFDEAAWRAALT